MRGVRLLNLLRILLILIASVAVVFGISVTSYLLFLRLGFPMDRALSLAIPTGPSFIVAMFTLALWSATNAQAEANKKLAGLQEALTRAEITPLLLSPTITYIYDPERPGSLKLIFNPLINAGRYGFVVQDVEIWVLEKHPHEILAWCRGSFTIKPGGQKKFAPDLYFISPDAIFALSNYIANSGDPFERSPRYLVVIRGIYGGNPSEITSVCLRIVPARFGEGQAKYESSHVSALHPYHCPQIIQKTYVT